MMKLLHKYRHAIFVVTCGLLFYGLLINDILQVKINFVGNEDYPITPRLQPQIPVQDFVTEQANISDTDRRSRQYADLKHKNRSLGNTAEYDDKVPKVIIVAYYRGGSSLTGSLFKWNQKAMYYFEPLHFLHQSAMNHADPLVYFNGTKLLPPSRGHELPYIYQILGGLLSCKFDRVSKGTLLAGMSTMSGKAARQFRDCHFKLQDNKNGTRNICFKELKKSCLNSEVRVAKEIRLPMESTRELLKTFPSLKIIHVIRDIRGMICSQSSGACKCHPEHLRQICAQIYLDITWRLMLEKEFPGRIMMMRYEDLAENPIQTAESVYEFLQMKLPISVAKLLYNSTMMGHEVKGMLELVRADSIATAYKWRRKMHWDLVTGIQKQCEYPLKHGQYPFYLKEKELREAPLPVRKNQSLNDKFKA